MRRYRRNPVFVSKICCAAFILVFYCIYSRLHPPALTKGQPLPKRIKQATPLVTQSDVAKYDGTTF